MAMDLNKTIVLISFLLVLCTPSAICTSNALNEAKIHSRKLNQVIVTDYTDPGPNPRHDPRKGGGHHPPTITVTDYADPGPNPRHDPRKGGGHPPTVIVNDYSPGPNPRHDPRKGGGHPPTVIVNDYTPGPNPRHDPGKGGGRRPPTSN